MTKRSVGTARVPTAAQVIMTLRNRSAISQGFDVAGAPPQSESLAAARARLA